MTVVRLVLSESWFLLLPLFLGMTWNKIKNKKNPKLSNTYVEGYLIWLSMFFVGTFIEYRKFLNFSYWKTVRLWKLALVVLLVACIAILNKTLVTVLKKWVADFKENLKSNPLVFVGLAFVICSVLFVVPSKADALIERGNVLISYDTLRAPTAEDIALLKEQGADFGEREPLYLELAEKMEMTGFSYPELFYTIPAGIFGLSLASTVHYGAAVGLLLFFVATYYVVACNLYKEEKKQKVFLLFIFLFYALMSVANVHLGLGVAQNIWNPVTLFISCLVPLTLVYSYKFATLRKKEKLLSWKGLRNALMLLCVLLVSQLMIDFGAGLCGILFVLAMILV